MTQIKSPFKKLLGQDVFSVFLAGSIEQGTAVDWQTEIAEKFPKTMFLNPRRENWDSKLTQDISNEQFAYQVNWELDYLEQCKFVFMYFQGDTKSPISLLELGLLCGMNKPMIVVCEPNFWRLGNVQVMADRFDNIDLYSTLEDGILAFEKILNDKSS